MGARLTRAQRELLAELPTTCVREYKPAARLAELGLAEWPSADSSWLVITREGIAALTPEKSS